MTENNDEDIYNDELEELISRFNSAFALNRPLYLDADQFEELADYYLSKNDLYTTCQVIDRAFTFYPGMDRYVASLIYSLMDSNLLKEAKTLIERYGHILSMPMQLARSEMLWLEGKNDEAEAAIESVKEQDASADECAEIGYSFLDAIKTDKAIYWFNRALLLNPDSFEALSGLCECLQMKGHFEETISPLNHLLDTDPYSLETWILLAKSHFALEQYDKTIEACEFALVINEKECSALLLEGYSYSHLDNIEESNRAFYKAWRYGGMETSSMLSLIASNYVDAKEWDTACHYLKKAIRKCKANSQVEIELNISLASCLFKMKKKEETVELLENMHQRFPTNINIHLFLSKYTLMMKEYDKASAYISEMLRMAPSNQTMFKLAIISLNCMEYEIALTMLKDIVDSLDVQMKSLEDLIQIINRMANSKKRPPDDLELITLVKLLIEDLNIIPSSVDAESFTTNDTHEEVFEELFNLRIILEETNELINTYCN